MALFGAEELVSPFFFREGFGEASGFSAALLMRLSEEAEGVVVDFLRAAMVLDSGKNRLSRYTKLVSYGGQGGVVNNEM